MLLSETQTMIRDALRAFAPLAHEGASDVQRMVIARNLMELPHAR